MLFDVVVFSYHFLFQIQHIVFILTAYVLLEQATLCCLFVFTLHLLTFYCKGSNIGNLGAWVGISAFLLLGVISEGECTTQLETKLKPSSSTSTLPHVSIESLKNLSYYRGSSIIGASITVILAIPVFIKKIQVI